MAMTVYAATKHGGKDFGGTNYTPPATWYVAFRNLGAELTGNNYSRIAITNNTTNWPVSTTNIFSNGVAFVTPTASGGDWLEADEAVLYDASTGGNAWYEEPLDEPFTLLNGQARQFDIGVLRIRYS
jgi:hypothetical protein